MAIPVLLIYDTSNKSVRFEHILWGAGLGGGVMPQGHKMHDGNKSGKILSVISWQTFVDFDSIFALRYYSGESFHTYTHDSFT